MIKTGTDSQVAAPPALGAGTALSAMLAASRLPATLDFILPRRAGWAVFVSAFEALSRPGYRLCFSALATVLLAASLARFVWLAVAAARGRKWSLKAFVVRGLGLALVLSLTRWSFSIWFEVSQKVWFPFGSMNILEPVSNILVCSVIAFVAMSTALSCLSSRGFSAPKALLAWAAVCAVAAVIASARYGAWRTPPVIATDRRLFVVLTEEEGRPSQAAYDLPAPRETFSDRAEREIAEAGTRRLELLRALYEANAKSMEPAALRRALMLGIKYGDILALSLLLDHLSAAQPSIEALGALGALADETVHRVGPIGASRIARAYAHLGDAAQAALWADRAAVGPRGIPAGLVDLSGGGALKPGRIAGRLLGLTPAKIALYRKTDPGAPYLLDAAALVASAESADEGRFSFSGLAAGRYYLAFAFSSDETSRGEVRISGHRGDLALDSRKTSLVLPPLTISRR